jgi:hypothetical protein
MSTLDEFITALYEDYNTDLYYEMDMCAAMLPDGTPIINTQYHRTNEIIYVKISLQLPGGHHMHMPVYLVEE